MLVPQSSAHVPLDFTLSSAEYLFFILFLLSIFVTLQRYAKYIAPTALFDFIDPHFQLYQSLNFYILKCLLTLKDT